MAYLYDLDKSSKKYICPQCNQKSFVAYVYRASNEVVDVKKYGRCDRESKCGAHLNPYQDKNFAPINIIPKPPIEKEIFPIFPEERLLQRLSNNRTDQDNFYAFCKSLTISDDHLKKWNICSDNNKTAFVFKNIANQPVNVKWFLFLPDGRRDRNFNSFSLKQPKKSDPINGKQVIKKYQLCLFGEHLLDPLKDRTACVVESEKTAVLASFFYPQFDWVACGSSNGLSDGTNETSDKLTPLFGRKVYWICDADKAGRSNSSINNLKKYEINHYVIDLFPERKDGFDLADAIIAGLRPEIKEPQKAEKKTREDFEELLYNLPKGAKWKEVKEDLLKYGHFVYNGRIYMLRKPKKDGENYNCKAITNFTIRAIGLIQSDYFPRRLIEITNIHKYKKILEVPTKAFASQNEFTVFVESEGNYQYDGIGMDLKKVRAKLYDDMESYEEVETLGWHKEGYLIFANGVFKNEFREIDEFGFVKIGKKNFYINALSCINKDKDGEWEDEKKLIFHNNNEITLKQWAALFCKVHGDNGKIALIWFISALFRDFLFSRLKFFPHWFGFGPPGTGKSQLCWSLRAASFTGIKKPFNLSLGTQVAFTREVSQFANIPCWYDEYDNSIDPARVQGLKGFYDGSNHMRSIKDSRNRTESMPVLSACLITGQHLPIADNALFTRVILAQFHTTEFTEKERQDFSKLQEIQEKGLPFITTEFIKFRKIVEKSFYNSFDKIANDFQKQFAYVEVHTRLIRNMAVLLTIFKVLERELSAILPFSYEEFKAIAYKNVKEQALLIQNSNETNSFWDMVSYLIDQSLIEEGKDYEFVNRTEIRIRNDKDGEVKKFPKLKELLFIRFSKILPLYKEHFNKQNRNANPLDKSSLIHYLQHSKAFIGSVKNHRFESAPTTAYVFDYEYLKSQDIELRRGMFEDENKVIPFPDSAMPLANSEIRY